MATRAAAPPLSFASNGTGAALPGLAAAVTQRPAVQLLAGQLIGNSYSSGTSVGFIGVLILVLMLWFFFGPGLKLPCTVQWELHCCPSKGSGILAIDREKDTCIGGGAPERFSPDKAARSGLNLRDGAEQGLEYVIIVLSTFAVITLFWVMVNVGVGGGVLNEKNYAAVVVFALSVGTAIWSWQVQLGSIEAIKILGCQPYDGWKCFVGQKQCVVKQLPCAMRDTPLFPGIMWTGLGTPSTYSTTLPRSDPRSTASEPTGGLTGKHGGVVAPGVLTTPFGAFNRPDKADESLETYIYRRIDPEHFAALDRERQIIFEEKKRKQISDRARRADALPYTPLFAADDPRSWTQETQRTDAPLSSSDD